MPITPLQREQAAAGLEQLAALVRAQSWRNDGSPSLPPTQASVLRMLVATPDGLRARAIAERLGVTAASLSDSLKALEGKGWIVRTADDTDRRAAIVRLTRLGKATARQLSQPTRGVAALVQTLDERDTAALLRITQLLVAQAQEQGLASGVRTCLGCRFFQPYASGDSTRPHLCDFTKQPFGHVELRADCAEHGTADAEQHTRNLTRFRDAIPH